DYLQRGPPQGHVRVHHVTHRPDVVLHADRAIVPAPPGPSWSPVPRAGSRRVAGRGHGPGRTLAA
ncbi:hypothetical protein, partial [Streptomyces sp. NPDC126514]|uniref:hypothetical protein n=1 Tax=Streptomyces sp. NPDC126514 TaxID=3155210 RepID=UPI00332CACBD